MKYGRSKRNTAYKKTAGDDAHKVIDYYGLQCIDTKPCKYFKNAEHQHIQQYGSGEVIHNASITPYLVYMDKRYAHLHIHPACQHQYLSEMNGIH